MKWASRPAEFIRVGNAYMSEEAKRNTCTPNGHSEGFIEAFANIYRNFALTVRAKAGGEIPTPAMLDFPTVDEGVRGMQFIETMVSSGYNDTQKWVQWVE